MSENNVIELSGRGDRDELTELIRSGARKLIAQALEAEVSELLAEFTGVRDERGRAGVVRNGYHPGAANPSTPIAANIETFLISPPQLRLRAMPSK